MLKHKSLSKEVSIKFSVFMTVYVLIVVLFHSDLRYIYPFIEELTAISTSHFFCVSAFFFYRGLDNENIWKRLKKRCSTLLLPYLLWNLIYILLYFRTHKFSLRSLFLGLTVNPLCTPSWYLMTLFIFLLLAPLIKCALRKSYSTIFILGVCIAISYLGYIKFQQELATVPIVGGYLIRMAEYVTPYLIGGIIGTWFNNQIYVNCKTCLVGIISSCIFFLLLLSNISPELRWLLWVTLPLTLWMSIPEKIFGHLGFLHWLTEPAFLINMMHCYLLYMWQSLTTENGFISGKYLSVFNVLLAVVSSYVLHYLLKWFIPNMLKVLTGNRMQNQTS